MEFKKVKKAMAIKRVKSTNDWSAYHKELVKISPKFIGLCIKNDEIIQIVVEDDFGDSEETAPYTELNDRLQELILNPTFGKKVK